MKAYTLLDIIPINCLRHFAFSKAAEPVPGGANKLRSIRFRNNNIR